MAWIEFISGDFSEKKDDYNYSVKWEPRLNGTLGIAAHSGGFPAILTETLEALVNYTKTNKIDNVGIELLGTFPKAYVDRIQTLFDLYSRAEKVKINYSNVVKEVTY